MMKIVKTLKGGSLSSTVVLSDGINKFVRKSISRSNNREYGLVRWQSQIRKLQLLNQYISESSVPVIQIGFGDDFYFYDVPYYEHSLNCVEALLRGDSVSLIAEKVAILLSKMAAIEYGTAPGSLAVYISEEVRSPLCIALEFANEGRLPLNEQELEVFKEAVRKAFTVVDRLLRKVKNLEVRESLTHGNLTLENMLWDAESSKILMIDPYAETYCESIMGDVSQLFQSSESGYEIISNLFESQDYPIDKYPIDKIPACFTDFSRQLIKIVERESWYSEDYLVLFRASQFTRMFPFKLVNSPRQGVAFMLHGIKLLEEISC